MNANVELDFPSKIHHTENDRLAMMLFLTIFHLTRLNHLHEYFLFVLTKISLTITSVIRILDVMTSMLRVQTYILVMLFKKY